LASFAAASAAGLTGSPTSDFDAPAARRVVIGRPRTLRSTSISSIVQWTTGSTSRPIWAALAARVALAVCILRPESTEPTAPLPAPLARAASPAGAVAAASRSPPPAGARGSRPATIISPPSSPGASSFTSITSAESESRSSTVGPS